MKKILLLGGLAVAAYMFFAQGKEAPEATFPNEFRELTDAEAENYLNLNTDLRNAFGNDLAKAKQHWRDWGYFTEYPAGTRVSPYLS